MPAATPSPGFTPPRRARAVDPGPAPKAHSRTIQRLLEAIAVVLDLLKGACVCIVFLAPLVVGALAGYAAAHYADKVGCWVGASAAIVTLSPGMMQEACNAVSSYAAGHPKEVGAAVGGAAAALTGVAEVALAPVTASVEAIGVLAAIFLALLGWLLIIFLLVFTGGFQPFEGGSSHFFIIFGAFAASMTPLIDAFPTFTPAVWKVTHDLRKRDAKKLKEWQAKKKAYDEAIAADRQAQIQNAYGVLAAREAAAQAEEDALAAAQEEAEALARAKQEAREQAALVRKSPALVPLPAYG